MDTTLFLHLVIHQLRLLRVNTMDQTDAIVIVIRYDLGWIQFTCMPGYVLDPNIGALYNCNNGVWSTKPQCLSKLLFQLTLLYKNYPFK